MGEKTSVKNTALPALQELQRHPQWVCWKLEPGSNGRLTKVPYNPKTGYKAKAGVASTWASYHVAKRKSETDGYSGIGYELRKETGITAVDLDACVDECGTIASWAREIIDALNSYTEYSPSGNGIHIFVRGTLPRCFNRKLGEAEEGKKQPGIEMYDTTHFFTVTGKHLEGTLTTLEDRQQALLQLHAQYATAKKKPQGRQAPSSTPFSLSDTALLEKARAAGNGVKFSALWNGDTSGYGSSSEADEALCCMLAYWTGKDASRMDRLFRLSGLYRDEKWGRNARSGETYGEGTIRVALELCTDVYNPRYRKEQIDQAITDLLNRIKCKQEQGKKKLITYRIAPLPVETEKILDCLRQNEWGDALLFAEAFAGQVCYDHTGKEWYLWAGHYWQRDTTSQIRVLIAGVLGNIYLKASADLNIQLAEVEQQMKALLAESATEADSLKDQYKNMKGDTAVIAKRVKELRGAARNKRVQEFIQSLMGITSDRWDTNPWLLATVNGVVNLHTGECRDGEPSDYIRTVAPTEWKGLDDSCPRFEQFLQEIFGDRAETEREELIRFLQKFLGYGITGRTNTAIFPILYGEEGRNGKDTLLGIIKRVLGAYVGAISNDVFLAQDKNRTGGAATPHLCDLQGKRLVWGSETKQGDKFNQSQVKHLTGDPEEISARQVYGRQYAFLPTHKLLLMTNYKPHADAKDKAFWQRACLIEFNLRFVANPQAPNERKADITLRETIAQEASGILAWLVRGCLDWQQQGLTIPKSVHLATDKYRKDEDTLLKFIEDCCIVGDKCTVQAKRLYAAYEQWCDENNLPPLNGTLFGEDMGKRYRKKRGHQGNIYQGIGLLSDDISPDDQRVMKKPTSDTSQPYTAHETATGADSEIFKGELVYGVYSNSQKSPRENHSQINSSDLLAQPYTPYTQKEEEISKPASQADSEGVYSCEAKNPSVATSSVATSEMKAASNGLTSASIPLPEHARALYEQVKIHISNQPRHKKKLYWYGNGTGFESGEVAPTEYGRRVYTCAKSGDPLRIEAACTAMRRTLEGDTIR